MLAAKGFNLKTGWFSIGKQDTIKIDKQILPSIDTGTTVIQRVDNPAIQPIIKPEVKNPINPEKRQPKIENVTKPEIETSEPVTQPDPMKLLDQDKEDLKQRLSDDPLVNIYLMDNDPKTFELAKELSLFMYKLHKGGTIYTLPHNKNIEMGYDRYKIMKYVEEPNNYLYTIIFVQNIDR